MYDYILPLVEFPQDGDKFNIEKAINTISNYGSMVALTLGKYGMDVDFTGVVGEDGIAKKIEELFTKYQVKLKYLEKCYNEKSLVSYKIYNSKSNKFTSINEVGSKISLTKYKYEFIPDVIIMDDKDYNANMAAINNYPNSLLIYVADKYSKQMDVYLNKCNYVIADIKFVSEVTGVNNDLDKEKNLVLLFQKFIDLYNTNIIIKLNNFDFLYCVNDEVRLIKNINKNISNKESVYYGVLCYFLANKYSVEESIKLTNKVMLESLNEIDLVLDIPDYEVIKKVIKDYEELKKSNVAYQSKQQIMQESVSKTEETKINTSMENTQNNVVVNNISNEQNSNHDDINQERTVVPVKLHNPNIENKVQEIEELDINLTKNEVNNG